MKRRERRAPWRLAGALLGGLVSATAAAAAERAAITGVFTLPRISLSQFGNPAITADALSHARRNGLKFTDLPSIGSGLAKVGENEFVGLTDRGPNGTVGSGDDDESRRTFPLPQFCPTVVRFKLADGRIQVTEFIPLRDRDGKLLTGLSNVEGEERLFESANARSPLPLDPNGVDPEAVRVLPDGRFLISEEYSPSILVVATNGEVLVRYTPEPKPLLNTGYPVKPILPGIFAQRRDNHGFESLAISGDGRFAYAILQGPMGDEKKKRFGESRVVRALKLDVSDPLNARVAGEYLVLNSPAHTYLPGQKQEKISISDAEWIARDKLLIVERGKGLARILVADFTDATNILPRPESRSLGYEDSRMEFSRHGVHPAKITEVFSTRDVRGITSDKLEGLALLGPDEIALANDNDFGIGDNKTGEPSTIWRIRVRGLHAPGP